MTRAVVWIAVIIGSAVGLAAARTTRPTTRNVTGPASRLAIAGDHFEFDGQPLQIISGEMHYPRVPREYWRDRLLKARAMGLNTISTYVFWNLHEPVPGRYDFGGQNDVATYIRTAGEVGLHVILRPGPYVCAEWDLGGYPGWLFADPSIVLRGTDPKFTQPAARWLDRLGRELAPLMSIHGGPIIAVQVENEYGSFGKDKDYLAWQRDALHHAGLDGALLYTADGDVQLPNGTLPDLPAVVNFGAGGAAGSFAKLAAFRPGAPLMSGEYWAGWFDQWGQRHHTTNTVQQVSELSWMLDRGYSVNLYMFHGGTTFGFMNGANIDSGHYHPQTSSYDYDAALDESGRPTEKYFAFRDAIDEHRHVAPANLPSTPDPIAIAPFTLGGAASLWAELPRAIHVDQPRSMESFGQSYGYILYRTHINHSYTGFINVVDVRDYVQVFVNGALVGTLDRRLNSEPLPISIPDGGAQLDLLVENSGRVNFAMPLRAEMKGITHAVSLGDTELSGWDVFTLPMSTAPKPTWTDRPVTGPAFYRGTFELTSVRDSFFDTRGWGKGTVWVNGHQLGRFWDIGPQQSQYVPAPWLRAGTNEVIVFDLETPKTRAISGVTKAIFEPPEGR